MLRPEPFGPIPEEILTVGQLLLPADTVSRYVGDELAGEVRDELFADMYASLGQPAYSPARLSLVLIFQALEHLSDRQAAHMVRTRIDWKVRPLTAREIAS